MLPGKGKNRKKTDSVGNIDRRNNVLQSYTQSFLKNLLTLAGGGKGTGWKEGIDSPVPLTAQIHNGLCIYT